MVRRAHHERRCAGDLSPLILSLSKGERPKRGPRIKPLTANHCQCLFDRALTALWSHEDGALARVRDGRRAMA
jgi:hypothetical protein